MTTRRQVIEYALAAGALSAAAPFAVPPAQAAALLDRPADLAADRRRGVLAGVETADVTGFAAELDSGDYDFLSMFENGAAEQMADYKRALNRLIDAHPELADRPGTPLESRLLSALDEAALALWSTAWMAGIRAGSQYEHLRLALTSPRSSCGTCHAQGRTWGGEPYRFDDDGTNEEACPDCGGRGTVPTPAPTLSLAAD